MSMRQNRKIRRAWATAFVTVALLLLACPAAFSQTRELIKTDEVTVTWGGYVKSLTTLSAADDRQQWDGSLRLRIKTEATYRDFLTLTLHYEIASVFGESFSNPAYRSAALRDPDRFANLSWPIADGSDYVVSHTLDRAYLTIRAKRLTFLVGRQRIAWGAARFISPLDLFNPFDPTAVDKEEKRGTDALVTEVSLGQFTGMSMVFAPTLFMDDASYAARFYTNLFDYDFSIMAGRFSDREVYGLDFSGQVGSVAVWGEAAWYIEDDAARYAVADPSSPFGFSLRESRRQYLRAALGAQYVFPNTLSFLVEYYYNGKGESRKDYYNWEAVLDGSEPVLAQNYLFSTVGYEITPLLAGTFSTLYNIDDGSVLLAPSVDYSLTENLYLTLGAQVGLGQSKTEYGARPEVYYLQMRYYF
jgi:hypothetical protein